MLDLSGVLVERKDDHQSETGVIMRDVTDAYAAGTADFETYKNTITALRNTDCSRCQQELWQFEVPSANGDGWTCLCHACYWKSSQDYAALQLRVRQGEVVEFGLGLLMHTLVTAFRGRYESVEYAEAGLMLVRLYASIGQRCEGIVQVIGEPPSYCGAMVYGQVCPRCDTAVRDMAAAWGGLVEKAKGRKAATEQPPTTETGDE